MLLLWREFPRPGEAMELYLGVDGGGTGCRAAIANGEGRILGLGEAGSANIVTDPALSRRNILTAVEGALGATGLGAEFGENKLRWTNLFIRDTIKQARLALGYCGGDRDVGLGPLVEHGSAPRTTGVPDPGRGRGCLH